MRISHVLIENFRNFKFLDVTLGQNIILVGENKSGKSNFIDALRLVLDPSLSDSERYLSDQDFWDGEGLTPFNGRQIKITIQFSDFAEDASPEYLPLSWLSDCLISIAPTRIAQITYLYYEDRKPPDSPEDILPISTQDDYNFKIYGGNDLDKPFNIKGMRKDIPLHAIEALRDIANDNRVWHRSPLNRLIKLSDISPELLKTYSDAIREVSEKVIREVGPLKTLEAEIQGRLKQMTGPFYFIDPQLGINATTPEALLEALRLFAEGLQRRPLERISLGLQNALYLSLLSLLLKKQQIKRNNKKEPFIPIVSLDEPEAHLHPHLQRLVFQDFLGEAEERKQPVIISTHSPQLATAAALKDLVLLKTHGKHGCKATSAYEFLKTLDTRSQKDLERFLDITKSEMLFSKGVLFVEGDVEMMLVSEFANIIGKPLDDYGISVCNVNGAHFNHVVTLAYNFHIPWVVITDGDPYRPVTGLQRAIDLTKLIKPSIQNRLKTLHDNGERVKALRGLRRLGIFVNDWTIEASLLKSGLWNELKQTFAELGSELGEKVHAGAAHIDAYNADPSDDNLKRILTTISDVRWGKGRFAHRLIGHIKDKALTLPTQSAKDALIPEYIKNGINFLINKISSESMSV